MVLLYDPAPLSTRTPSRPSAFSGSCKSGKGVGGGPVVGQLSGGLGHRSEIFFQRALVQGSFKGLSFGLLKYQSS